MRRRAEPRDQRYLLRFAATAFLLISGTLVLVLYVLPERYILSSGFRESGMSFPTPTTPFVPAPVVRAAARTLPAPPPILQPGPAELFWSELAPLLSNEAYADALEHLRSYLREYPGDRDAHREYVVTLLASGSPEAAVPELRRLLAGGDEPAQRLLLARTLRDLGRVEEAAVEYRTLAGAGPDDVALWLEWARAHAWIEEYDEAAAVLEEALLRHPDSTPLRVELARVEFSRDGLEAAAALLAGIDDTELMREDAVGLRDAVLAALAVPEPDTIATPALTLLEQAQGAREADDFTRAVELFAEALGEAPDDWTLWQAYADLLEYELGDMEGARSALVEVERLGPESAALQYRLAQLEIWTGRNDEAHARLETLLPVVEADPSAAAPVTVADVHAALGDLARWGGDRVAAGRRYDLALEADPDNARALAGFEALEAELARLLVEVEQPRAGATSYALADTDDFSRLDIGGEWVEVDDDWSWGGSVGNRWLDGRALDGLPAGLRQGAYLDLEAARWWRWGTLRTAARFGVERVLERWDYSAGAALTHRDGDGSQTELSYEHGPAYPVTATLQSAVVGVIQDHVTLSHARRLDARWSATATMDGALLRSDLDTIPGAVDGTTARLQAVLAVGRQTTEDLTLGLSARAVGYTSPGPAVTDAVTSVSQRLFWDPRLAVSVGPFARLDHDLSSTWSVTGNLGPGVAFIDERTAPGWDVVPHVSAEAGLHREGSRFWTSLDVFFYQGQFDGYRMYGARFSLSARDWSRLGGGP